MILSFLNQDPRCLALIRSDVSGLGISSIIRTRTVSALWVTSYFGLCRIARLQFDKGDSINVNEKFIMRPLDMAASLATKSLYDFNLIISPINLRTLRCTRLHLMFMKW